MIQLKVVEICLLQGEIMSSAQNLTGKQFGMLTAKRKVGVNERGNALWECECECGNLSVVPSTYLKRGIVYSCGCKKKLSKTVKDLTGKKVGKLTVIEIGDDLILPSGTRIRRWKCKCECGKETLVIHSRLLHEETKSCGCLVGKKSGRTKCNEYEIIGNIAYISLNNTNERAICDKDKVEELKQYCWHVSRNGYAVSRKDGKWYRMHRIIANANCDELVDHMNRNKLDNRIENLRIASSSINNFNKNIRDSKSGITGVYKRGSKWRSTITVNHINIHLGYFDTLEEAIESRNIAELKYYGELKEK